VVQREEERLRLLLGSLTGEKYTTENNKLFSK
jgi:hypothetical protein